MIRTLTAIINGRKQSQIDELLPCGSAHYVSALDALTVQSNGSIEFTSSDIILDSATLTRNGKTLAIITNIQGGAPAAALMSDPVG